MEMKYDIIVIGAGHAGIEASWIAASLGISVGTFVMPGVPIAETPCNPAVGGVGKGQIVREIDAMGGLIGRIADMAAIHYKTLNDSKGYAVRSTRVQVDKTLYSKIAEDILVKNKNIDVIRKKITRAQKEDDQFVLMDDKHNSYCCKKLIICAGTFLDGLLHTGDEKTDGGIINADKSPALEDLCCFQQNQKKKRFKTGTPARLDKYSIQWEKLKEQPSDSNAKTFHMFNNADLRINKQISCHITKTNEKTLSIIRDNKDVAPLYNGQIKGVGPRYCPSIEDKAFRYIDRNDHQLFLEPEGLDINTVYPNGISTSLPKDVQEKFVRTISGLENTKFIQYGYAVEYDVVDATSLDGSLEHNEICGLYFAGQINGTSGYEEAAAQGLVAGINAAQSIRKRPKIIFDRNCCYIGVLIEDIITNVLDEPYRLFTSRAENRLYIREDNTVLRMYYYRKLLGVRQEIDKFQEDFIKQQNLLSILCNEYFYDVKESTKEYFRIHGYGNINKRMSLKDLLKRADLDPVYVLKTEINRIGACFNDQVIDTVAITKKYEGYINRAEIEFKRMDKMDRMSIDWKILSENKKISNECRQRIGQIRPKTFSQLRRINGIRPATIAYIASYCST
ncbi:MAG: tRNA uridine-5-carboxymethylaminomethyl(34) synthesis enzyme MnmG [Bacteriovoracaceae bacterium]|nr:tRNA uridine-5-carboxymethylaminomethyl(34) synthesis enzyme MnmG [Bacteriovoracaceae bacterium]